MSATIFHNPRCRKSRETLSLLQDRGVDTDIVEYLKHPPTKDQLDRLCTMLGLEPIALIRRGEKILKELSINLKEERSRDEWLTLMTEHPILIERPIVVIDGKAALGRPPENVLSLI